MVGDLYNMILEVEKHNNLSISARIDCKLIDTSEKQILECRCSECNKVLYKKHIYDMDEHIVVFTGCEHFSPYTININYFDVDRDAIQVDTHRNIAIVFYRRFKYLPMIYKIPKPLSEVLQRLTKIGGVVVKPFKDYVKIQYGKTIMTITDHGDYSILEIQSKRYSNVNNPIIPRDLRRFAKHFDIPVQPMR